MAGDSNSAASDRPSASPNGITDIITATTATTESVTTVKTTTAATAESVMSTDLTVTGGTFCADSIFRTSTADTRGAATASTNTDSTDLMCTISSIAVFTSAPSTMAGASADTETQRVTTLEAKSSTDITTVFDTGSVFGISTTMIDTIPTTYFTSTSDTTDFPKAHLDFTTKVVTGTIDYNTLSSSTVSTGYDASPDVSGISVPTAPSRSPALDTEDILYKTDPILPDNTTPGTTCSTTFTSYSNTNNLTVPGRSTDSEVSISDPVTPLSDSNSSDSPDSAISGTDMTNQITSTSLLGDGTTTSTGAPTTAPIPELTPNIDGAPFGDTAVSAPTNQASFAAGTDTTFPDVPPDIPMNIPPPDVRPTDTTPYVVPLPDFPLQVPPSNILPPDILLPGVPVELPSPVIPTLAEAQPNISLPGVPPSDETPPDKPSGNVTASDTSPSSIPIPNSPSEVPPTDEGPLGIPLSNVPLPNTPLGDVRDELSRLDEAPPVVPPFEVFLVDVLTTDVPSPNALLPDVPLPDIPFPETPPEVCCPVEASPDFLSSDVSPENVINSDLPCPEVPPLDVTPKTPSSKTTDTLIDVAAPDGAPLDEPVESSLPCSEQGGGVSLPDNTFDQTDPAGGLASVDFTFPFLGYSNPFESGVDSRPMPPDDLGNIPDDSRVDIPGSNSVYSGMGTMEERNRVIESPRPDSSTPNGVGLNSRPDSDPGVDYSTLQVEGKSPGEDPSSGGSVESAESEQNRGYKEENAGEQKGTECV